MGGKQKINIYYLHKNNNIPFYIGKTKNNLKIRIKSHKRKFGADIQIKLIEQVDSEDWKFWESYWIEQFQQWGFILENKNQGGGGCISHSSKSKSIISDKLKQREYKQEWKENLSKSIKGKKRNMPDNYGEIISKAKKGIPNPKLREARLGKPHPKKSWKILCFDLNNKYIKSYNSAKEAGVDLDKKPGSIRDAASGRQKTAYGYIWRYEK